MMYIAANAATSFARDTLIAPLRSGVCGHYSHDDRRVVHITTMAMDGDLEALAQQALELDSLSPLIEHDPAECETCSEYQAEFLTFARGALPKLAQAYIELRRSSLEAFENAKLRGRFLDDLQEENERLEKELAAREAELDELQREPQKKGWLR